MKSEAILKNLVITSIGNDELKAIADWLASRW